MRINKNNDSFSVGNALRIGERKKACYILLCLALVSSFQLQFLSLVLAADPVDSVKGNASDSAAQRIALANPDLVLSVGAREAAELLGIYDAAQRFFSLRKAGWKKDGDIPGDEELGLQVHLLDKITCASLEVRVVSDRIDRELSWSYTNQGGMLAKRQRNLNDLFTLNFMQGGILGTIAGQQNLLLKTDTGNKLLLVASAVGLALSSVSLVYSKTGHRKIDGGATVLARVFNLPTFEPHKTDMVFKYLNSVAPDSKDQKTRRQVLIDTWKQEHYLDSTSEPQLRKLAALGEGKESIALIGHRIRMLHDTQWMIERFDEQLLDLLRSIDTE